MSDLEGSISINGGIPYCGRYDVSELCHMDCPEDEHIEGSIGHLVLQPRPERLSVEDPFDASERQCFTIQNPKIQVTDSSGAIKKFDAVIQLT